MVFIPESEVFFSYAALMVLKLFSTAQHNIFYSVQLSYGCLKLRLDRIWWYSPGCMVGVLMSVGEITVGVMTVGEMGRPRILNFDIQFLKIVETCRNLFRNVDQREDWQIQKEKAGKENRMLNWVRTWYGLESSVIVGMSSDQFYEWKPTLKWRKYFWTGKCNV